MTETKLVNRPPLKLVLGNIPFDAMSTAISMFVQAASEEDWTLEEIALVIDAAEGLEENSSAPEAMALLASYCENDGLTVPTYEFDTEHDNNTYFGNDEPGEPEEVYDEDFYDYPEDDDYDPDEEEDDEDFDEYDPSDPNEPYDY